MITGINYFQYPDSSIYTACITEVNTVYKGNIKPGIVNIIVEGGAMRGVVIQRYHQIYAKRNKKSVFFCKIFNKPGFPDSLRASNPYELKLLAYPVEIERDSSYSY